MIEDDEAELVERDPPPPHELKRSNRLHNRAKGILFGNVSGSFMDYVDLADSAKDAWTVLEVMCTSYSKLDVCKFMKAMFNVEKGSNKTIHEYVAEINDYKKKIVKSGATVKDDLLATIYLCGLPPEYDNFVLNFKVDEELKSTEVLGKLLVEEQRVKCSSRRPEDSATQEHIALKTTKNNPSGGRGRGRGRGGRGANNNNSRKCFVCDKEGHISFDCPSKPKQPDPPKNEERKDPPPQSSGKTASATIVTRQQGCSR